MPESLASSVSPVWTWLERHLLSVQNPGQYAGREWNMVVKDPTSVTTRVALAFPDVYQIGMSHTGLKILYGLLNERDDVYAERVFAPWPDLAELMRHDGVPLFSLETYTPLRDFDILGFSLQYELAYTTILWMLDMGGIPLRQAERDKDDTLVIAGGPIIYNAEPVAPFIDLMVIGDGEEALVSIVERHQALRKLDLTRREMLAQMVHAIPGLYAPSLYDVTYAKDGTLESVTPNHPLAKAVIPQTFVENLDTTYFPEAPVLPNVEVVHDRLEVEIMRGCTQGCRFCHAGYTKRPLRHRWPETIARLTRKIYENTGYDEIALTSLSSADYPYLRELVSLVRKEFDGERVSISLPSLRINERSKDIPKMVGEVRKSGLTFAPEAASETLRRRINKNISDEDLLAGCATAWEDGWKSIKLYFIIGIPDETDDDVLAILSLADRVSRLKGRFTGHAGVVNCAISTFVPKPHTPYQWDPMNRPEEIERKKQLLKLNARNKRVNLKFHTTLESTMEGVLSKGDRRVAEVLLRAYELGCRLDAWGDQFRPNLWYQAFEEMGVDPEWYVHRTFGENEPFSWEHLKPGVSRKYLWIEREKARRLGFTSDCRDDRCHGCGVDETHCFK